MLDKWVITNGSKVKLTTKGLRQRAYYKVTTKGSQRGSTTNHLQTRGSRAPNDLGESAYEEQHANYSLSITGHNRPRSQIAMTILLCEQMGQSLSRTIVNNQTETSA